MQSAKKDYTQISVDSLYILCNETCYISSSQYIHDRFSYITTDKIEILVKVTKEWNLFLETAKEIKELIEKIWNSVEYNLTNHLSIIHKLFNFLERKYDRNLKKNLLVGNEYITTYFEYKIRPQASYFQLSKESSGELSERYEGVKMFLKNYLTLRIPANLERTKYDGYFNKSKKETEKDRFIECINNVESYCESEHLNPNIMYLCIFDKMLDLDGTENDKMRRYSYLLSLYYNDKADDKNALLETCKKYFDSYSKLSFFENLIGAYYNDTLFTPKIFDFLALIFKEIVKHQDLCIELLKNDMWHRDLDSIQNYNEKYIELKKELIKLVLNMFYKKNNEDQKEEMRKVLAKKPYEFYKFLIEHDCETLCEIFDNFVIQEKNKTTYDFSILYNQQDTDIRNNQTKNNSDSVRSNKPTENKSINWFKRVKQRYNSYENTLLYKIIEVDNKEVWKNDLVKRYIEKKNRYYLPFLLLILLFFPIFQLISLIGLIITNVRPFSINDTIKSNCTILTSDYGTFNTQSSFGWMIATFIASIFIILREILQFIVIKKYNNLLSHDTVLDLIELFGSILSIVYAIPVSIITCDKTNILIKPEWQNSVGSVAILLVWTSLMTSWVNLFSIGKYALMLFSVLKEMIKFILIFLPIFFGFVFAFYMILNLDDFQFKNGFMRTLLMVVGEFNLMDTLIQLDDPSVEYIILFLFVIFVNFIFFNMLVGISIVNPEEKLNSQLAHLRMRLRLIIFVEVFFDHSLLRISLNSCCGWKENEKEKEITFEKKNLILCCKKGQDSSNKKIEKVNDKITIDEKKRLKKATNSTQEFQVDEDEEKEKDQKKVIQHFTTINEKLNKLNRSNRIAIEQVEKIRKY